MPVIAPGTPAPQLSLRGLQGEAFTNADLEGATTVLVFFPYAFSSVCTDQMQIYNEVLADFADEGATLYGVSCDAPESQNAFRRSLGIDIEMLSDWEPKGEVCRAFGVYHPAGMATRALVIIGPDGVVRWSWEGVHPGVLPGANLIFDGLAAATE
jgi:peroxiredoxin (alkyl hydroperoxide reductase subunit C)